MPSARLRFTPEPEPSGATTDAEWLHPLGRFGGVARWLRNPTPITAEALPALPRQLLDHHTDMTPTLEAHFAQTMRLRVLERIEEPHQLTRLVVLFAEQPQQVAEFGAIEIHLDAFAPEARAAIESGSAPLGTILNRQHVAHSSDPSRFLSATPASALCQALWGRDFDQPPQLFGRCNLLARQDGQILARVLELLPETYDPPTH